MMRSESSHHLVGRQGFSLIEVLVAILILALGLLGLGAVFPAVILQQRNAVDSIEGESVVSMAEAIVTSSTEIIDFSNWFDKTLIPPNNFGMIDIGGTFASTYEWVVDPMPPYDSYPNRPGYEGGFLGSSNGQWFVDLENLPVLSNPLEMNQVLTVADRLVPQPYSGKDPKYIWDVVARRQPGSERPQLGIFIRQIDARIRVPDAMTLSDVLVVGDGVNGPILPVAIINGTHPTPGKRGLPVVDNGIDNFIVYAAPQTLTVSVYDNHLDWLVIDVNSFINVSVSFATKPGQKLLDNSGTVRTVLGPPLNDSSEPMLSDQNLRVVRVYPPFAFNQASNGNPVPFDAVLGKDERASWIRQIVFTPRTPFAIRVITLKEPSE